MDWREESCSKRVNACFGPTLFLWLEAKAVDLRRRTPGEVLRLIAEEAYERERALERPAKVQEARA